MKIINNAKSLVLAIAFLLSWAVPTFGQEQLQLYIYNEDGYNIEYVYNNKVTINDSNPFYLVVFDGLSYNSIYSSYSSSDVVNITTNAYNGYTQNINLDRPECLTETLLGQLQKFQIPNNKGSRELCWKYDYYTFSIAIHELSEVQGSKEATCSEDGYVTYKCRHCGETRTEIFKATGHFFGEWQEMEMGNGRFRTCTHDESHKQYNMDATGVNALELTLTDGTTLTYPYTLSPVVTFNDYYVAVSFDTGKTSLVNKTDITGYNQVWSHNKNLFTQNDDKTYSHQCDYEGCDYKHDDLFVKNGEQYYVAEKKNDVIRVADMTLNDSEGYDCEADITVSNVSYARDMTGNQWGTLCLPFAINPNAYSDCSFYQFNSVDNKKSEIVLSRIDDPTIASGTPVLVRRNAAVNGISISVLSEEEGEGVAMSKIIRTGSTAGDFTIVGTLKTSDDLANNAYIINNDKFWNVGDLINNGKATSVKVGAFHSYLLANTTSPSAQARMLSLSIGDDDTTAIDVLNAADNSEAEIYDLNGHRLSDLQKGINIVKRGNKTTKVIIR